MLLYLLLGLPLIKGDDVAAYVDTFPSQIPHCDMRGLPPSAISCIHLAPDGSLVHAKDLRSTAGSAKQMLMDMHLRGVVKKLRAAKQLPGRWVSFLSVYTASGPATKRKYPVVGIGKRDPRQPGLLMPNPFFVAPDWWDWYSRRTRAVARKRAYDERRDVLLFRGACGPGGHERLKLMRLGTLNGAVDAGWTSVDGYTDLETCVADLSHQLNVKRRRGDGELSTRVPMVNYSHYRYLLHMPGSATGSYSRNLQYLWSHGAVVLIWRHDALEWYYPFLRDGVHYVSVDETDLERKLGELRRDPERRQKLVEGGAAFFEAHLRGDRLVDRWKKLFDGLAAGQADAPPRVSQGSACSCDAGMAAYASCEKCEITRKRGNTVAKFLGLIPKRPPQAPAVEHRVHAG